MPITGLHWLANRETVMTQRLTGLTSFCRACRKSLIVTCNFSVASGSISTFDVAYGHLSTHSAMQQISWAKNYVVYHLEMNITRVNTLKNIPRHILVSSFFHQSTFCSHSKVRSSAIKVPLSRTLGICWYGTYFFYRGKMLFLPPNQQHQTTIG